MSGLDELRPRRDLPVIVMMGHGDVDACRRVVKRGALDFLRKPVDGALIDTVQQALRQQATQRWQDDAGQTRAARVATLSARERVRQAAGRVARRACSRLCGARGHCAVVAPP
ncbi:Transcriptional regulatory protein fixJ [Burkholderia anthina]|nr:Transcriptional regulatory protein fixJ [Burkholderia anthina]